jgi:alpha-tubulin suppressor-like RCC1 family protein
MPKIIEVGTSEYRPFFLYDDGTIRASVWDGGKNASVVTIYPQVIGAIDVDGGQYNGIAIDKDGKVWILANNAPTATLGPIDQCVKCYEFNGMHIVIRKDGTVWAWGSDPYKFSLSGTPKQISPTGLKFTKLVPGLSLLGLTDAGDVYEWANGNLVPSKKISGATDIFGSWNNFKGCVIKGRAYGWGNMAFYGKSGTSATPVDLGWNINIAKIVATWNVIHIIDTNGDLYGQGDNAMGEVGNGYEKVNKAELVPNQYLWDWAIMGGPMVYTPVKIGSGFKDVFGSNSWVFYHWAVKIDGTPYSWGRNKSLGLGNKWAASNEADFPNALDVASPTQVDPLSALVFPYPFSKGSINVLASQNVTSASVSLQGTAKPAGLALPAGKELVYKITSFVWSQVSGPSIASIKNNGDGTAMASGLKSGAYVFNLQVVDNNGATMSAKTTINVAIAVNQAPNADPGVAQIITLPLNQVTLDASASVDSDGKIVSYAWSKLVGPCGDVIAAPGSAKTVVSFQQAGQYTYQLAVVDDDGLSDKKTVTVTVLPEVAIEKVVTTITLSDGKITILQ